MEVRNGGHFSNGSATAPALTMSELWLMNQSNRGNICGGDRQG
jgi:hypothetical protein